MFLALILAWGRGEGVLGLVFLTSIADSPAGLEKSERTCHLQKRLQVTCPGGGGDICFNFCWECVAGLSEPLAHYSLFCGLIIDPIFDPNLVTFYFCIYLILNEEHFPFHLQYKHSGTFSKYKELSYPKNQKMYVRPHSSNSIKIATPL